MRTRMILALACTATLWLPSRPASAQQFEAPFTTAQRYNAAGQVVGTIQPDPDGAGARRLLAARYTYSQGLLRKVERGELTTWADETVAPANWANHGFYGANILSTREYGYDADGRKTSEALRGSDGSLESLIEYSYDRLGRVECRAVRMNPAAFGSASPACSLESEGEYGPDRISRFTYNIYDQVLTEERAVGTALQQTYINNGYSGRLLMSQTDANGNRTELDYDSYKRLWRRYYPSPTTQGTANPNDYDEYTYEANGNLRTERKRNGTVITHTYDGNNRRILKDLSDNTHSDDVGYDYDLRGLTLASYFASTPGIGVFNDFDGFGRLETATSTMRVGTETVSRTLGYGHDADGNRTRITHPDGTWFQYSFDGMNRVDGVLENGADTLLTLSYGADGQRGGLYRGSGAHSGYGFDNAGRLGVLLQDFTGNSNDLIGEFYYNPANQITDLTQSNPAYRYVGNNNISGNYAPNGLNQYSVIDGRAITYDPNGNLTSDGSLGYSYDMENRLVATSGVLSGLKYDPLGRLVEIGIVPGPTTHFLYDGDALVAEYTVSGNSATLAQRYVHGDRADEPWVQYTGVAVGPSYRRYLHADHQGSIVAQSDNTGGVLFKNAYDAYGIPASGNVGRFGYTGQTWLKELELHHYQARMYAPRLGRFLQTDPIGDDDDHNLYAYVGNDPLNRTDPLGLFDMHMFQRGMVEAGDADEEAWNQSGSYRFGNAIGGMAKAGADPLAGGGYRFPTRIAPCACFAAGTQVETNEGSRPIETLRAGDIVLARDPATGATSLKPITAIFVNDEKSIWELEIADDTGAAEVHRVTDVHPYWVAGSGWVQASQLLAGMRLTTVSGIAATVVRVSDTGNKERTYNFSVQDFGTYFVGQKRVLVHNCPHKMTANIKATIKIDSAKNPAAAKHIQDAQKAGQPRDVTIDRDNKDTRRAEALSGQPKAPSGQQRDEYPPAMFKEGGKGSSVQNIPAKENASAGATTGNTCRALQDGDKVRITTC